MALCLALLPCILDALKLKYDLVIGYQSSITNADDELLLN